MRGREVRGGEGRGGEVRRGEGSEGYDGGEERGRWRVNMTHLANKTHGTPSIFPVTRTSDGCRDRACIHVCVHACLICPCRVQRLLIFLYEPRLRVGGL